jgi:hypothetical protein
MWEKSMSQNTYFEHHGSGYDAHTRSSPALRFLEHYSTKIDSADYAGSFLPYYHPNAIFHDATGVDYVGGAAIWKWIIGLFGPMSKIHMETQHLLVISRPDDGTEVIYGEWTAHFWVRGREEKVSIPRSMVFTLGKAEGEGEVVGFEGLQIVDVRLYYDRSMLVPFLKKSAQELEKFGANGASG